MRGGLTAWIGRTILRLAGWRVDSTAPQVPKYVLLAAPHTSNWDFVVLMAAGMVMGIWPHWVGKHTLFRPPFGPIARALRGIPVDRRAPHWKSGFYRVALAAKVPIALGYVDFRTRTAAIGPLLMPSGDVRADMDVIRAFYADIQGLHPEWQGPIRLESEDRQDAAAPN